MINRLFEEIGILLKNRSLTDVESPSSAVDLRANRISSGVRVYPSALMWRMSLRSLSAFSTDLCSPWRKILFPLCEATILSASSMAFRFLSIFPKRRFPSFSLSSSISTVTVIPPNFYRRSQMF
jgi:hypothetical protein